MGSTDSFMERSPAPDGAMTLFAESPDKLLLVFIDSLQT
ncbi:hypothetical protein K788_0002694 [Paraburkholderia caribensis MBA4]|uniref:Uncharacterized protein n=1 Tax=Paraburkholderia caribensis MBA4 TaxID=1323664 RepID=A0A0N7JUE3_9BURK|nr:hypothetical protein K788_0002694 [Paraburkholderia caribensis MBA4]